MGRIARGIGAAGAVAAALAMMAGPASAAPGQGQGLNLQTINCGGQEVPVTSGSGAAGFVLGDVYVLTQITGTVGGEVVFSKTFGQRNGAGTPITCTETDGEVLITL